MKVNVGSINPIIYKFIQQEALPKYENIWRANGDNEMSVIAKSFIYTTGAKLMLKQDIVNTYPVIKGLLDSENNVNIDDLKEVILETIREFKNSGKNIVIPKVDWQLDEEDIHKLYNIAQEYKI